MALSEALALGVFLPSLKRRKRKKRKEKSIRKKQLVPESNRNEKGGCEEMFS